MAIDTQNSINQASSSLRQFAQKTQGNKGELNKNDFLNLFMTQISNQDPMSPMDSAGMMSQLSQLGSMEQLQNLNTKIDTLASIQEKQMKLGTAGYLGLEVSYKNSEIQVAGGQPSPISYKLEGDAKNTQATILDSNGEIVRKMSMGTQAKGTYPITWDGMTDKGELAPDGSYRVEVVAASEKGSVGVDMSRTNRIEQVSFDGGSPMFHIGGRKMSLEEIQVFDRKAHNLLGAGMPFGFKDRENTAQ